MSREMSQSDFESTEIQILRSRIVALEQLLDVYEKSVVDNTDKLYKEITEREKAEESLHSLNLRHGAILASVPDMIMEVDNNKVYTWANQAGYDFFGPDVIGKEASFYFEGEQETYDVVQPVFKGDEDVIYVESWQRRKDGQIRLLGWRCRVLKDERGQVKGVLSSAQDITERKKAEEALIESEGKYSKLVEQSNDGIAVISTQGMLIFVNSKVKAYTGYDREEILNQPFLNFVVPEERPAIMERFTKRFGGGAVAARSEFTFLKKDQTRLAVEANMSFFTYQGQPAILSIIRDITERKQAEEKLKQAYSALIDANKKLEEHDKQVSILGEMTEMLQLCPDLKEISPIITSTMVELFPELAGVLFIYNNSRTELQSIVRWGEISDDENENTFTPDLCWGLRRGKIYIVNNPETEPVCAHLKYNPTVAYACLPLIAKGEILGLLHLREKQSLPGKYRTIFDLKEIGSMLVEYLSLSIANIKLRESLTNQAIKDPLTGLFNRRYMEEALQRELSRAERKHTRFSVVMMDIDHFKQFNDIYGHEAGDELLVKLAEFFRLRIRQTDIFCRFGGEEFIMILPESTADDTFKRVDLFREEVKSMSIYFHNQRLPAIALSMGIAAYPEHGINTDGLIQIADKALYKAKLEGRDRVIIGSI